jgi:hypothetical protein
MPLAVALGAIGAWAISSAGITTIVSGITAVTAAVIASDSGDNPEADTVETQDSNGEDTGSGDVASALVGAALAIYAATQANSSGDDVADGENSSNDSSGGSIPGLFQDSIDSYLSGNADDISNMTAEQASTYLGSGEAGYKDGIVTTWENYYYNEYGVSIYGDTSSEDVNTVVNPELGPETVSVLLPVQTEVTEEAKSSSSGYLFVVAGAGGLAYLLSRKG